MLLQNLNHSLLVSIMLKLLLRLGFSIQHLLLRWCTGHVRARFLNPRRQKSHKILMMCQFTILVDHSNRDYVIVSINLVH